MNPSTTQTPRQTGRYEDVKALFKRLGGRNYLLIAFAVGAVALWFKADALAAVGALPLLLAVLPCLAMCTLGLCEKGGRGQSGCSEQGSTDSP